MVTQAQRIVELEERAAAFGKVWSEFQEAMSRLDTHEKKLDNLQAKIAGLENISKFSCRSERTVVGWKLAEVPADRPVPYFTPQGAVLFSKMMGLFPTTRRMSAREEANQLPCITLLSPVTELEAASQDITFVGADGQHWKVDRHGPGLVHHRVGR